MAKSERWYEIDDGKLFIYNMPFIRHATSISIVKEADLAYYKKAFKMHNIWDESIMNSNKGVE